MKFSSLPLFSLVFLLVLQIAPIHQVFAQELCKQPCEFRFAVYGDSRSDHATHREIVSRLVVAEPELILTTGDAESLGDAILELVMDVRLRWRIGVAAAAEVRERWLWPHVVRKMRGVYREAALDHSPCSNSSH